MDFGMPYSKLSVGSAMPAVTQAQQRPAGKGVRTGKQLRSMSLTVPDFQPCGLLKMRNTTPSPPSTSERSSPGTPASLHESIAGGSAPVNAPGAATCDTPTTMGSKTAQLQPKDRRLAAFHLSGGGRSFFSQSLQSTDSGGVANTPPAATGVTFAGALSVSPLALRATPGGSVSGNASPASSARSTTIMMLGNATTSGSRGSELAAAGAEAVESPGFDQRNSPSTHVNPSATGSGGGSGRPARAPLTKHASTDPAVHCVGAARDQKPLLDDDRRISFDAATSKNNAASSENDPMLLSVEGADDCQDEDDTNSPSACKSRLKRSRTGPRVPRNRFRRESTLKPVDIFACANKAFLSPTNKHVPVARRHSDTARSLVELSDDLSQVKSSEDEEEDVVTPVPRLDIKKSASPRNSIADALGGSMRTLAGTLARANSVSHKRKSKFVKKSRLVQKSGASNVMGWNVPKRDRQFLRDLFNTMIDVKWRWLLLVFVTTFVGTWIGFALFYFLIAWANGDLGDMVIESIWQDKVSAALHSTKLRDENGTTFHPCFMHIDSFIAAFLFSIETQHTIGYGSRYITPHCPHAILLLCVQCCVGLLLQSFMVGIVFAKMARAKKRAQTLIFSEHAVISLRDGMLCLLVRLGDMRDSHLVETHVRMQLISQRVTEEGEVEPLYQCELSVGERQHNDDRLYLVWPVTLCHAIDAQSPLYDITAASLAEEQFEIIVLLEGIVESTGMTVQARTSYLPKEIKWGYRFEKLVTYQHDNGSFRIDYGIFDSIYSVKTPTCSARELQKRKMQGEIAKGQFYDKAENEAKIIEGMMIDAGDATPMHSRRNSTMQPRTPSLTASYCIPTVDALTGEAGVPAWLVHGGSMGGGARVMFRNAVSMDAGPAPPEAWMVNSGPGCERTLMDSFDSSAANGPPMIVVQSPSSFALANSSNNNSNSATNHNNGNNPETGPHNDNSGKQNIAKRNNNIADPRRTSLPVTTRELGTKGNNSSNASEVKNLSTTTVVTCGDVSELSNSFVNIPVNVTESSSNGPLSNGPTSLPQRDASATQQREEAGFGLSRNVLPNLTLNLNENSANVLTLWKSNGDGSDLSGMRSPLSDVAEEPEVLTPCDANNMPVDDFL